MEEKLLLIVDTICSEKKSQFRCDNKRNENVKFSHGRCRQQSAILQMQTNEHNRAAALETTYIWFKVPISK